ncbi:hypothetical protein [Kribbella capetownensis]|uniref:hypothetical protein n=1 Tax=Kribbella capetownensis TaxID=1572659 RepID=UPI0013F40DB1|nr:hypothetical protein [Kribbella capetownensis]
MTDVGKRPMAEPDQVGDRVVDGPLEVEHQVITPARRATSSSLPRLLSGEIVEAFRHNLGQGFLPVNIPVGACAPAALDVMSREVVPLVGGESG